ncbi:hypothetical protein SDC9_194354 [bioreactor metagenome]|uniref:Uncharacterized protein n=1 Tax=bioreactor metagenome TaxID=1076179 RepID=A0A645I780_9ZZZZ
MDSGNAVAEVHEHFLMVAHIVVATVNTPPVIAVAQGFVFFRAGALDFIGEYPPHVFDESGFPERIFDV